MHISKKLFLIATMSIMTSVFANSTCPMPKEKKHWIKGYNAPAKPETKCAWDVLVSGSLLYYQPRQSGLELGFPVYTSPTSFKSSLITLPYKYDLGFKAGIGIGFNHDTWEIFSEYTNLHSSARKDYRVPANATTFVPLWRPSRLNPPIVESTSHWKLHYDIIDFYLARHSYVGKKLFFKPHFGLRGGWIDQNYKFRIISNQTVAVDTITSSDSWLLGPLAGLDTTWKLGWGFNIFTNTNVTLLHQRFYDIKFKEQNYSNTENLNNYASNNKAQITPNFDLSMGFEWSTYFDDRNKHIDIGAGYDFVYYWNQNMMNNLKIRIDIPVRTTSTAGSLMLHGLIAYARFDF